MALAKLPKKSTGVAKIALDWTELASEACNNIRRWWKGEISGKRCAANIATAIAAAAGGVGGACAGALVGAPLGPGGSFAGDIVGGYVGNQLASILTDWFTRNLFDLPKDEALENAFNFLGLHHTAENSAVNTQYRKLCQEYHPDKDGSQEAKKNWHKLQVSMEVIKCSRGQ